MARDHIVPRMLLRRFADDRGRLAATNRISGAQMTTTAARACREGSFYNLDDIHPDYAHLAPFDQIERSLADFEGRASQLFDRFADDRLDLSDQDRFDLTLFIAFQAVRGWTFREELSEIATLVAKQYLQTTLTDARLRADLRSRGEPHDAVAIARWREQVLRSGWKVVPSPSEAVRRMVDHALNVVQPRLFCDRVIQLIRFEQPALLVSDEPVALWVRPERDTYRDPVGIVTADILYLPVDRRHAIALARSGEEKVVTAERKKARLINRVIAGNAHRWVFQHPDDRPVDVDLLPDRVLWGVETLGAIVEDDEVRVQKRFARLAPADPPNRPSSSTAGE